VIRLRRRNRQPFIRAFLDNSVGEHGRGGGAVAGLVRGLARNLAHHLYAHVLELVIELDLLGDGDPVLADAGDSVRFVENDVAALGAERPTALTAKRSPTKVTPRLSQTGGGRCWCRSEARSRC